MMSGGGDFLRVLDPFNESLLLLVDFCTELVLSLRICPLLLSRLFLFLLDLRAEAVEEFRIVGRARSLTRRDRVLVALETSLRVGNDCPIGFCLGMKSLPQSLSLRLFT
jgi:hypothetical protein